MLTWAYIAIFAILGAWARYGQSILVQAVAGRAFPWATLSINVLGSFLMGFLFFETVDRITMDPSLRTGILTGGLGAYTTFSTFALENLVLLQDGETLKATLYVVASNVLGIGAAIGGAWISRNI
ncbi:MAG: fluoride efflux transporter CrcB [Acidiferrobacter sp.]